MGSFSDKAINFYQSLGGYSKLTDKVSVMNPYRNEEVIKIINSFYKKFFNDNNKRTFIIGINPGRFGGGVTGISFTDPIILQKKLSIENNLLKKPELSCQFIYKVIDVFGGPVKFYSEYFLTALFPLALIKNKINYNYYDDPAVYKKLKPFIIKTIREQIDFGADNRRAISLGKKNFLFLKEINNQINFFNEIIYLDHPRFIMQYKRRFINDYIEKYIRVFEKS
jgi:hypothetical protein